MTDYEIAKKYINKIRKCKSSGMTFTLSFFDFKRLITANRCKYTGVELTNSGLDVLLATDVTIDRVDNLIGYVPGNVVACCHGYNTFKAGLENPNNIISFEVLEKALKVQKMLWRSLSLIQIISIFS